MYGMPFKQRSLYDPQPQVAYTGARKSGYHATLYELQLDLHI